MGLCARPVLASNGLRPAVGGVADHGIDVYDFRRGRGPVAVFGHIDYAYHRYLLSIVHPSSRVKLGQRHGEFDPGG